MLKVQSANKVQSTLVNEADFARLAEDFDLPSFETRPGMLYARVRAISARVNRNFDGFRSAELKKSYQTFAGRPIFVNHDNHDPLKARGKIVASAYRENGPDKYIETLMEVDAKSYPKLAKEIEDGNLDSVSMGCDVQSTKCSYCNNIAKEASDFCDHILYSKGMTLPRVSADGRTKEAVLVYEDCQGVNFFELSFVFDPADETALAQEVIVPRMAKVAFGERTAPPKVDTLRSEEICPECGSDDFDGSSCKWCEYQKPPEQLQDPDLEKAKETDLRQEQQNPTDEGEETGMSERKPSLAAALKNRNRRLADVSVNEQPDEGAEIVKTPAETTGITTQDVMDEGATTDPTNLDNNVSPDLKADQTVDVTKLHAKSLRAQAAELLKMADQFENPDSSTMQVGNPDTSVGTPTPPGTPTAQDPDGDGDDDTTPQGDTDNDYAGAGKNVTSRRRAMRRRADQSDDLTEGGPGGQDGDGVPSSDAEAAEPGATVDVTKPVANTTDDRAQDSQYTPSAYDNNQGDDVKDPDETTDQNWVPGSGQQPSKDFPKASSMSAMVLAEAYVDHGIIAHEARLAKFAELEKLPQSVVNDRLALFDEIKQASTTKRTASRGSVPRSMQTERRTVPSLGRAANFETTASAGEDVASTLLLA